jgi:DNA-binding transcriptional MocR family regulator
MPRIDLTDGERHLYKALARELSGAIARGTLKTGDRLPSTRLLSSRYGVSMATAVQAFRELENCRQIEARPRSGFFVAAKNRQFPEPGLSKPPSGSHNVVMPTLLGEYFQSVATPGSIALGAILPPPNWFPAGRLTALLSTMNRRRPELNVTYKGALGASELREALARRSIDLRCHVTAEDIVITNGCLEALNLSLRAVAKPGDTIAIESPTYFMLLYVLEALGLKALELPTHPRTGISLDALDAATAKRGSVKALLVMPNYANPLGSLMPDEHKARLVQLCVRRGVAVIEDDVYGDTHYGTTRPLPLKAWDRDGNVLHCSSLTKTLAPGLRIGWVAPGRYFAKLATAKRTTTGFTPYVAQLAVAEYLDSGGYDRHLRQLRSRVANCADRIRDRVRNTFPTGCRVTQPLGGYALWVELPRRVDAIQLFRRAREKDVVVAPGPLFTSTNRYRNFIRVSHSQSASSKEVDEALGIVGELAHAMLNE